MRMPWCNDYPDLGSNVEIVDRHQPMILLVHRERRIKGFTGLISIGPRIRERLRLDMPQLRIDGQARMVLLPEKAKAEAADETQPTLYDINGQDRVAGEKEGTN